MPAPLPPTSPWGPEIFNPTWVLSEWQRTTRNDPLVNMGKDEPLPECVDIAVIGSGLAGAKTAHSLLSSYPAGERPSIITLEAREACSGASGRNAGHCRPDAFRGFTAFSKLHGDDQAAGVLMSEAITLGKVKEFIEEHNVDCEFIERNTLDVVLSQEFHHYCQTAMKEAKAWGLDVSHIKCFEGKEAQAMTRSPNAFAAYQWPAASLNPSKLCYAIHKLNNEMGAKLFTWTPVTAVTDAAGSGDHRWNVQTPRGSVLAKQVVFATNGYTPLLLPEMEGLITSLKAQAVKLDPPPVGMDKFPKLNDTMSLRYMERFYSVMQRPDDSIILSAPRKWPGQSASTFKSLFGTYDDSRPLPSRTTNTYSEFIHTIPEGGYKSHPEEATAAASDEVTAKEGSGGLAYSWAGILGLTPDSVPFLGAIPNKPGQFMIAGFNGHGMARIFHLAPCLASVIRGEGWDETVPRCFELTEERVAKLREGMSNSTKPEINVSSELEEKLKAVKV